MREYLAGVPECGHRSICITQCMFCLLFDSTLVNAPVRGICCCMNLCTPHAMGCAGCEFCGFWQRVSSQMSRISRIRIQWPVQSLIFLMG